MKSCFLCFLSAGKSHIQRFLVAVLLAGELLCSHGTAAAASYRISVFPAPPRWNDCPRDGSCPLSRFSDTDIWAWYHDGLHFVLDRGLMKGISADRFAPDDATSRAMIVTVLWRMEGEPRSLGTMTFVDVPDGAWYADAVRWAAANGLVNGYSPEYFGPGDDVSREQLATILYRYAQYRRKDVAAGNRASLAPFTDKSLAAAWGLEAFNWAVDTGVILGTAENTLSPKANATRAQVAVMLMRYLRLPVG